MSRYLAVVLLVTVALFTACNKPATGPLKGVLLVVAPTIEDNLILSIIDNMQLYVTTVDTETVFDFSTCSLGDFNNDLKTRRTVLFIVDSVEELPSELQGDADDIYTGYDIWAENQSVFGIVAPSFDNYSALSSVLEDAYNAHLKSWIYTSFVATQMSSPARIDSLVNYCGFSIDIPKSWRTAEWNPTVGFIQYQRKASDNCQLIMSIRWIDDNRKLSSEEAVIWREEVARGFFYAAAADSVDRDRVQIESFELHGYQGYKILGMWRNPEFLNAGAFTSYILFDAERRYILDVEVFHEHGEKEPYIREGWIIMNTFIPGAVN